MPRSPLSIPVRLPGVTDRSYVIHIGAGIFPRIPLLLQRMHGRGTIFIITDSNVRRLYGRKLASLLLLEDMSSCLLEFPAGEESKNTRVVEGLQTGLLHAGIRRDSIIVALGGGVVGDVAGFVASTILRGVRYVQVPTSLLAQVDSSVGGKVGIDHPVGKNLIGAFHQPSAVYIDPGVLSTLAPEEFRNGLAEIVKVAAALDPKFFRRLESIARNIGPENPDLLTDIIAMAVRLKAAVVQKDERETGLRKILNLGHTIGHALETSSGYEIKHGPAVSIGMAAEADIACRLGLLQERDRRRLLQLLRSLRLPTKFPRVDSPEAFRRALLLDKKADAGGTKYVLLNGYGRAVIGASVPATIVDSVCGLGA
jgi:3-dehydroquinate synthase